MDKHNESQISSYADMSEASTTMTQESEFESEANLDPKQILEEEHQVDERTKGRSFEPVEIIGKGKYGTVLAAWSGNEFVALKVIRMERTSDTPSIFPGESILNIKKKTYPPNTFNTKLVSPEQAYKEVHFMRMFSESEYILKTLGYQTKESPKPQNEFLSTLISCFSASPATSEVWIVSEMFSKQSAIYYDVLAREESSLRISDIKVLFVSIILALKHIHDMGYAHRDVKPGNILLHYDNNRNLNKAVLCDFGACSQAETCRIWIGTLSFLAPEYYRACHKKMKLNDFAKLSDESKEEHIIKDNKLTNRVDVYALGMTVLGWFLGGNAFTRVPQETVAKFIVACGREINQGRSHLYLNLDYEHCIQTYIKDLYITRYKHVIKNRLPAVEDSPISRKLTVSEYFEKIFEVRMGKYPKLFCIIANCLNYLPERRPTYEQLLNCSVLQDQVERLS